MSFRFLMDSWRLIYSLLLTCEIWLIVRLVTIEVKYSVDIQLKYVKQIKTRFRNGIIINYSRWKTRLQYINWGWLVPFPTNFTRGVTPQLQVIGCAAGICKWWPSLYKLEMSKCNHCLGKHKLRCPLFEHIYAFFPNYILLLKSVFQ